jgi:hypothetical protein
MCVNTNVLSVYNYLKMLQVCLLHPYDMTYHCEAKRCFGNEVSGLG